jgi:hypothetical protein
MALSEFEAEIVERRGENARGALICEMSCTLHVQKKERCLLKKRRQKVSEATACTEARYCTVGYC